MAFKPAQTQRAQGGDFEYRERPVPRAGSRKARVSLIIDLGTQEREPFEESDGSLKEQKPCQQVAVFADLVADKVDYGGEIGVQQYRLGVNKEFRGEVQGINFTAVPQKDAAGNILKDANGKHLPYVLHPASPLSKIAKAAGREDIIKSMDIEGLLNLPFMATVEVKVTEDKNGKLDKNGKIIVYKNVNFKGAAQVPEDDDGNPLPVPELSQPARCITFSTATKDDITFIRAGLRRKIKTALNYSGSAMQKAIEAWEEEHGVESQPEEKQAEDKPTKPATPPAKKTAQKTAPKAAEKPETAFDDMDDDVPF